MKTPLTREQEIARIESMSDAQFRAEAKADRMVAGYIATEFECGVCNVQREAEDEDCKCPVCGESLWPVMVTKHGRFRQ